MVHEITGNFIWFIIFDMVPFYVHFAPLSAHSGPFYMIHHFEYGLGPKIRTGSLFLVSTSGLSLSDDSSLMSIFASGSLYGYIE